MTYLSGVQSLYAKTAHRYEQQVIPVFGPLARDLADWITRCANDWQQDRLYDPFDLDETTPANPLPMLTALDIGTGTGILARMLAKRVGGVIGVDLSPHMLRVAADTASHERNIRFVAADLHDLPLRRGAVHLITSSFGLNASTPKKALKSLAHILDPGRGVLAFQEWAAEDDCTRIVNEAIKAYAPDDIPGLDDDLYNYCTSPKPWYDQLQYVEDYYEMLKGVGFELVWVSEAPFVTVHLPSIDTFLAHKLVWPMRRFSLEAMTPEARAACDAEMRTRLGAYVNTDGSFNWSPPLFRVFAVR